jgi:hypothetical protein
VKKLPKAETVDEILLIEAAIDGFTGVTGMASSCPFQGKLRPNGNAMELGHARYPTAWHRREMPSTLGTPFLITPMPLCSGI